MIKLTEKHRRFLGQLRDSGVTNMWGAAPYIKQRFPHLTKREASEVLTQWINSFKEAPNENRQQADGETRDASTTVASGVSEPEGEEDPR